MGKFIKINLNLINIDNIADIHTETHEDPNTTFLIINTNNGINIMKPLPEHIGDIDDITGAYIDLITSFLASNDSDELVLDLNAYDLAE